MGRNHKATDWEKLRDLIAAYAEAYYEDAVKGGGDPADYAEIEQNLKQCYEKLNNHMVKMEQK